MAIKKMFNEAASILTVARALDQIHEDSKYADDAYWKAMDDLYDKVSEIKEATGMTTKDVMAKVKKIA